MHCGYEQPTILALPLTESNSLFPCWVCGPSPSTGIWTGFWSWTAVVKLDTAAVPGCVHRRIMSRGQCVTVPFQMLWFSHCFWPIFGEVSWALGGGPLMWMTHPSRALRIPYTQHVERFSALHSTLSTARRNVSGQSWEQQKSTNINMWNVSWQHV